VIDGIPLLTSSNSHFPILIKSNMFTLCSIKVTPSSPPSYHWTPLTQRRFLEVLAQTGSIKRAGAAVSMSRQAVYAFRRRKDALANTSIQCQLPEKSAISEMAISSPLAHCAMSGHRAASP
jgi:hypothetical protein